METISTVSAVSLPKAGRHIGVSHSKVKELCRSGELRSFRVGRRRLVSLDAIREFIAEREAKK